MLIVDEAHNCAPSGRGKYATDSLRTQPLRVLAPHFEHKLFLTATPHNGYPESFRRLLELLDNQRFARGTQPDRATARSRHGAAAQDQNLPPSTIWAAAAFPNASSKPWKCRTPTDERRFTRPSGSTRSFGQRRAVDQTRTICHRVRAEDAQETALFLPCRLSAYVGAAREVAARHPQRRTLTEADTRILQRQIDRMDEEYADDDECEEATAEAFDTATLLFARANR